MTLSPRVLGNRLRSYWLNLSLAAKGIILATVPLATILLAAAPIILNETARVRANDALLRTHQGRENAGTILRQMLQAQNHMLGFILTGDTTQLAALRRSSNAASQLLAATDALITDTTTRPIFLAVRTRVTSMQVEMAHESELAQRATERPSTASAVRLLAQENRAIADVENSINALIAAENQVLQDRMARLEAIRRRRAVLVSLVVVLGALGAGLSAVLFMSGVAGRVERMQLSAIGSVGLPGSVPSFLGDDELGQLAVAIHESRQESERTANRLRMAMRAARIEVLEISPDDDRLSVVGSGSLLQHMGLAADRMPRTLSAFILMIHPDDRDQVTLALRDARPGREYAIEFRMDAAGEDWRWMEMRGATPAVDSTPAGLPSGSDPGSRPPAVGVLLDITDRRAAVERARVALIAADGANKAKSEFLSRMSHELRTPLNAVLGFAQLLEMETLTADQKESVGHIVRGGRYLLNLINEVLDLARIEAGRLGLALEPVLIRDTIEAVAALIGPQAAEFGVRLHAPTHRANDCAHADGQRLQQVLLNLLSNAIKYNRRGGSVELFAERVDETVRIHVRDTGPGMSPEQLERLFQPFERLDAARTTIEGTGLGLALSRTIVEAMGGRIQVESEVGSGSTFTVELDVVDMTPEQREVFALDGESESRVTVVYVEDNPANLRLVERIARRRPRISVVGVDDGARAVDTILRERPVLVLLDLNLPSVSGDAILLQLRADPATRDVPVAILSADATPAHVSRLLALGAQYYLTKPIDVGRLLEVFDACVPDVHPVATSV